MQRMTGRGGEGRDNLEQQLDEERSCLGERGGREEQAREEGEVNSTTALAMTRSLMAIHWARSLHHRRHHHRLHPGERQGSFPSE
jgi:hypothetical protein